MTFPSHIHRIAVVDTHHERVRVDLEEGYFMQKCFYVDDQFYRQHQFELPLNYTEQSGETINVFVKVPSCRGRMGNSLHQCTANRPGPCATRHSTLHTLTPVVRLDVSTYPHPARQARIPACHKPGSLASDRQYLL